MYFAALYITFYWTGGAEWFLLMLHVFKGLNKQPQCYLDIVANFVSFQTKLLLNVKVIQFWTLSLCFTLVGRKNNGIGSVYLSKDAFQFHVKKILLWIYFRKSKDCMLIGSISDRYIYFPAILKKSTDFMIIGRIL